MDNIMQQYIKSGWALVPIPAGSKGPRNAGWNLRENCITSETDLARITGNVGLAHAYSGTCCLDIDDLDAARAYLAGQGIYLDALLDAPDAIRIDSGRPNRAKLLYRLPTPLPSVKLAGGAFELRCATRQGATVQDVLPPSIHPDTGKPYEWRYEELVCDPTHPPTIPDALLELWQQALQPAVLEQPAVATTVSYSYVKALLAKIDPDCDYEQWLRVGMALHHDLGADGLLLWNEWSAQGAKYKGLQDLEKRWRGFGRHPGPPVTLASLRVQEAASDDEFEDLTKVEEPQKPNRFTPIPATDLLLRPDPGWHIKGVIPRANLVVVYGSSGAGKTFVMLDMSTAVATGSDWRGKRTVKGRVVYVVAEGVGGFKRRIDALVRQGVPAQLLEVIPVTPNLMQANDVRELIAGIGKADMIVLDTFAQVTPGANENASEDMGKALGHCRVLARETGATVVLVHHSGKDEARGARGWSGLKAAADAELEVTTFENNRMIRCTKQKDGEDGALYPFALTTVQLGVDDDGDPITSSVVEHLDEAPAASVKLRREPGPVGKVILEVVRDLAGLEEDRFVSVDAVIAESVNRLPHDPQTRDQRRARVAKGIERLVADARLVAKDNEVAICAG